MKKIDYYAVQQPWRMPKWLGATIGGIFGFILIICSVAIVKLTKSPAVAVAAVAAAPAATTTHEPAAVAPAAPTTVAAPSQPVAQADEAAPVATKHHGKHHASSSHHAAKAVASAKKIKGGTVLASAKHDNKKLHEKDALDKLLGL